MGYPASKNPFLDNRSAFSLSRSIPLFISKKSVVAGSLETIEGTLDCHGETAESRFGGIYWFGFCPGGRAEIKRLVATYSRER